MKLKNRARVHAALGDPQRLKIADSLTVSDMTVTELGNIVDMPSNLLAHHLDVLENAKVIKRRDSEGDGRRRYVVLNPKIAGLVTHGSSAVGARPLFICTHNSARSQFAAAMWAQRTEAEVSSAGTDPAPRVNPMAVSVASEYGLDLSHVEPHGYHEVAETPDIVISVCDKAGEGYIPWDVPHLHWSIPDPVRKGLEQAFRKAFDDIAERIGRMLDEDPA